MSLLCHHSTPKPNSNSPELELGPEPVLFHRLRLQLKCPAPAAQHWYPVMKMGGCGNPDVKSKRIIFSCVHELYSNLVPYVLGQPSSPWTTHLTATRRTCSSLAAGTSPITVVEPEESHQLPLLPGILPCESVGTGEARRIELLAEMGPCPHRR